MPAKNSVKIYADDAYYHVYNRGVEKRDIFLEDEDYRVFLNLLKRYLSKELTRDSKGREYANFYGQIELVSYCLMPNHFHMLVWQDEADVIQKILKSLISSYSSYFNKKI